MATMFTADLINEQIVYLSVLEQTWIVMIMLTLLFSFFVTRKPSGLGAVLLPMLLLLKSVGLYIGNIPYLFLIVVFALAFLQSALSDTGIGDLSSIMGNDDES